MTSFTLPIPTYQCHKRVQALKIRDVVENPRGYELHFEDARFVPMQVGLAWLVKHIPSDKGYGYLIGGYAVWYEDGYMSWSPGVAFEAGYTLIELLPVREVLSDDLSKCQRSLMEAGKPYPKTCPVCGLSGKCKRDEPLPVGPATLLHPMGSMGEEVPE